MYSIAWGKQFYVTYMKYLFGTLSLLMLLFAYFQYNDPDPALWMTIYGYCAVILGMAALNKYNTLAIYLAYIALGAYILRLFPSFMDWLNLEKGQNLMQRMDNSKMYIEETREFFGLWICILSLSLIWIPVLKKK